MKMHIYFNLQFIASIISRPYNFGTWENLVQLRSKHAIIITITIIDYSFRHPIPKPYNFVTAYGRMKRNFRSTAKPIQRVAADTFNVSMDFAFTM
jgi:hypothetical protein